MILPLSDARVEVLLRYVNQSSNGASVKEIEAYLTPRVPRRTLQAWVSQLVRFGRLRPRGAARSRRYFVPDAARQFALRVPPPAEASVGAAVSPAPAISNPAASAVRQAPARGVGSRGPANGVNTAGNLSSAPGTSNLPPPPAIDPRYAALLHQTVPKIVSRLPDKASAPEMIMRESLTVLGADPDVINPFVALVMKALGRLDASNIVDYGIRLKDYELWKKYWR